MSQQLDFIINRFGIFVIDLFLCIKIKFANNFKVRMLQGKMAEEYAQQEYTGQQFFSDINTRLRDLEERQRILKDRMVLVSESLIREKEKSFNEAQEMKKVVAVLKEDNGRMKEMLKRIAEKIDKTARNEDLMLLQRQFDLFRKE